MGFLSRFFGETSSILKGGKFYLSGQYDKAIEEFTKALRLDPSNIHVYQQRGLAFARSNRLQEAIGDFEQILNWNPPDRRLLSEAAFNCARAYEKLENCEKAAEFYGKAIEMDPANSQAWCNRGSVLVKISEFEEAKKCLNEALRLDPKDVIGYFNRAILNQKLQEYDETAADLKKFLELAPASHPDYSDAQRALAQLTELQSRKQQGSRGVEMPVKSAQPVAASATIQPKYREHYETVSRATAGSKHRLRLLQAAAVGPLVELAYRWEEKLDPQEADNLDTRARAFIACAIYEAAIKAGLSCQNGPRHGQRPSWMISGEQAPYSLMKAGFDTQEKVCWMHVGPMMGKGGRPMGSDDTARRLAEGFAACLSEITA